MKPESDFAGRQIRGTRENQEDFYGFCELTGDVDGIDGLLLVLADGMGAYAGGSLASRTVVEAFVESFCYARGPVATRLLGALRGAERALTEEIIRQGEKFLEMGATLVAVLWKPGALQWISVGDSSLYLFRRGKLKRLNADHSMAPLLDAQAANGEITAEEAAKHPKRGTLRAALADQKVTLYDLREEAFLLEKGDLLFAASDGLNTVREPELQALLKKSDGQGADQIAQALLQAVTEVRKPKQDNTTVALIRNGTGTAARKISPDNVTTRPVRSRTR
jgi:serine/threonine protein phosphatase PrpC